MIEEYTELSSSYNFPAGAALPMIFPFLFHLNVTFLGLAMTLQFISTGLPILAAYFIFRFVLQMGLSKRVSKTVT